MHRTLIAICTASLLSTAAPLLAQSHAQYDDKDMTISGCLERNKSGGFWLTNGDIESAGSKARVAGTTGSKSADKDMRRAMGAGLWNLENGKDLDRYVNQRIEVTGRAKRDTSG